MKDLTDILKFTLGFMPWILLLFISGHTLVSLDRAIIICLFTSVIFGYDALRKGFILQWGTLVYFSICAVMINLLGNMFFIMNMGILSNGFLASIIWLTIFTGKPFTLQYARDRLPKERWNDPGLIRDCRYIALVWGFLVTFSTLAAGFQMFNPGLFSDEIYLDVNILTIAGGILFTQLYNKKIKKIEN